ncbi:hypothetical protein IscW_ISCW005705 [Ixodes scapularis]|uniref:FLYWCH-type domain-containing protein n=1 Tax=Ixodes scapularis TaxID=6945 RepID=B7PPB6_IXOSC|nr:hypothetical protein IscW_ISCW005705 [Ixodes scapularis]|eukprot:XP_002435608.1 hypothetical protein IscW_ISCW005705 [Ixodes scapularis]
METFKSNKGGTKLRVDGYIYTKQKDLASSVRWHCVKRGIHCKGALIVDRATGAYKQTVCHNHPPDDAAISVAKTRIKMKEVGLASKEKPAAIVAQAVRDLSEDGKCLMKSEQSLKHCIRQQRGSAHTANPVSLRDLVVEPPSTMTADNQPDRFLCYDNGPETEA